MAPDDPGAPPREPAQGRAAFPYNPALDAVRGIAVLAVAVYHTGLSTGGWLGVELFFILSGYLITSLLVHELDATGRIDLVGFWRRRARRLLPGIFLVLGLVAVFTLLVAQPTAYHAIRRDVLGALTYTSNWVAIYGGGGYWAQFTAPSPLRHMWSLAVEEQYYLAYPFLALVLLRRRVRSVLVPAAAVVAIAWQVFMAGHASVDRVYLGTDTRAAGLLVGAVVAILPVTALVAVGRYGAPVALAGLVVGGVLLDGGDSETFRGPFQLAILAGAVLLLGLRPGTASPVTRLIARRPLIAIGRWSYGIYLFHWPLAELLRQGLGWGDVAVTAVAIPAAIAIAAGSYAVVESPLRRRGLAAFGRPWPTVGACAALACVALVATSVGAREPLVAEDVAAAAAPVAVADAATTGAAPRAVAGVVPRPADRPYRLMLVGDSVGASLVAPLEALAPQVGLELFSRAAPSCSYDRERTTSGDFVEEPTCVRIVEGWRADVERFRPDAVLFVYGSWSGWEWAGSFRTQCDPLMAARVRDLYGLAVDDLGSTGAPVFMVGTPYWRNGGAQPELDRAYDCLRDVLRGFVAQRPADAAYVDLHPLICRGADCERTAGGEAVRSDGLHFAGPGALTVAVVLLRAMIEPPAAGWPATVPIE